MPSDWIATRNRTSAGPCFAIATLALVVTLLSPQDAESADGDPIALRRWPDGSFSIETHWGFEIIGVQSEATETSPEEPHRRTIGLRSDVDHQLDRRPNENAPTWKKRDPESASANAVLVRSLSGDESNPVGLSVRADGVSILLLCESRQDLSTRLGNLPESLPESQYDAIVLPAKLSLPLSGQAVDRIRSLRPRRVVLSSEWNPLRLEELARSLGSDVTVRRLDHNTLALSKHVDSETSMQVVVLPAAPWEMPEELGRLFDAMEASCARSQQVFGSLSSTQLNFRPSNGTHTPRWNAEHMMGRQLLFFSQIFHAVDPVVPVMDLNPKQMPPDYSAAHPDWNGNEEARQMQRVSDFTRRFAYLLRDVDLDRQAPGSRWTLRALLRQMERHYDQHTENTKKKFELPNWPNS